jgi:hypothetical protein
LPYERHISFAMMCDNGERQRIALMAVVCSDNVATNDGQDGPSNAPTMIRRRYVATSHSPTPYYCQRQTAAVHRCQQRGGGVKRLLSACSKTRRWAVPVPSRAIFFSNAFRLPACRIVPVPYVTPYRPGTILHPSFVPYVRRTYKLVLSCVRYVWFCDPPVLAAARTDFLLLYTTL